MDKGTRHQTGAHYTIEPVIERLWCGRIAAGDVLAQLLALNQSVYARIQSGDPVTAPGIPADYPAPAELVSEGCIMPPAWE
jgi:hypothetical protein